MLSPIASTTMSMPPKKTASNGDRDIVTYVQSKNLHPTPSSLFGPNFFLCGFVYLTYFLSSAIVGQFLSIFYQSKGFDGKDLGMLSAVVPLTSFLLTPAWSKVMTKGGEQPQGSSSQKHTNSDAIRPAICHHLPLRPVPILPAAPRQSLPNDGCQNFDRHLERSCQTHVGRSHSRIRPA